MSEAREPEAVASSGGYCTMQEPAPEVDPARRSVSASVHGTTTATGALQCRGRWLGMGSFLRR